MPGPSSDTDSGVIKSELFHVVPFNKNASDKYWLGVKEKDEDQALLRFKQYFDEIKMWLSNIGRNAVPISGECENPVVIVNCSPSQLSSSLLSKGAQDFAQFAARTLILALSNELPMNNTQMLVAACNGTSPESISSQHIKGAINRICSLLSPDDSDGDLFPFWIKLLLVLSVIVLCCFGTLDWCDSRTQARNRSSIFYGEERDQTRPLIVVEEDDEKDEKDDRGNSSSSIELTSFPSQQ